MLKNTATLALVTAVLALGPVARAQDAAAKIDIVVDDVPLADAMRQIAQRVQRTILVMPAIEERLTVSLREIPWRDAVDVIARMTRCEVEELPGGVLVLDQPPRVTVQLVDGDLRSALILLAAYSGKSVLVAEDVGGRVTIDLQEERWDLALEKLLEGQDAWLDRRQPDLIVVRPGAAPAAPAAPAPAPPPALDLSGQRITLDLVDLPLPEACARLGDAAKRTLLVDPAVNETVRASLVNVPWRAAVAALARLTFCSVEDRGDVLVFVQPPRISYQADGATAGAWFELLGRVARDEGLPPEATGRIHCDLKELEPHDVRAATVDVLEARRGSRSPGPTPAPARAQAPDVPATLDPDVGGRLELVLARLFDASDEGDPSELLFELDELVGDGGPPAVEAARDALAQARARFAKAPDLAEAVEARLLSVEGHLHLSAMVLALRRDDFASVRAHRAALSRLVEPALSTEREELLRAAMALGLRAEALEDRATRLELISRISLVVTAVAVDERPGGARCAIVNGVVVEAGEHPSDASGARIANVTVVEIVRSTVRFRADDTEFVRELGR